MKNYIILISVLFLFLQAVSRNTVSESEYTLPDSIILVKDSVYYYIYKSGNEILYAREKTSYINEDGDILSYIYQTMNSVSGIWNNSELYNLTYNTYGLNIGKLKRIWDVRQKAWLPYENSIFEYDGNGNKIRNIYITWDSEISDWSNNLREDFKYDTSGMLTEYILFEGKDLGHDWQNLKKNTYAYNEQGNIEEYISYLYDINSASWINSDKEEYIYDLNNFLISLLIKKWDDDFNIWRNDILININYADNGMRDTVITEIWNNADSTFVKNRKDIYVYDSNKNVIEYIGKYFDEYLNEWINADKMLYSFDNNNNNLTKTYMYWNKDKNEWIYSYKYEYTYIYDKLASVLFLQRDTDNQIWNKIYKNIFFWSEFKPEKPELPDNLLLYPNPVKKILILAWKSLESGTADIFSSEGKFIRRYKIADDKSEIDVSQYPEGFYILKINTSDNKTATRKFIKIK